MNIVVIDPDLRSRRRLHRILARAGHAVLSAADEATACRRSAATPPHIVFLRARGTPGCGTPDGTIPTLRAMASDRGVHIVLMVSGMKSSAGTPSVPDGVDDLLPIPYRPADVHARLRVAGLRLGARRGESTGTLPVPVAVQAPGQDALTGLPTREVLDGRLERAIAATSVHGGRGALVKVNIDNCRDLNAAYGHTFGDQVIRRVGDSLGELVGTRGVVSRDAGDEFLVLLEVVSDRREVAALCDAVIATVQARGRAAGQGDPVSLSLGFAMFPEDAASGPVLKEQARLALAEAKNSGRGCWRDFATVAGANPMISGSPLSRLLMEALRARRLETHFQPIVGADDRRVAGFEALVRWQEDGIGWVPPNRFVPVAEARGLIVEMERQVAGLALAQLARWHAAGHEVGLSLNVSKRSLAEPGFCEGFCKLAEAHHLDPSWITLEATERQSLLHDPVCRQSLQSVADAGFLLALDDFGSGHSSFDMVADLPFDELKIDMSLGVKARSGRGRRIVQAILEMCGTLGVESVVEGIEDASLARVLRSIGASRLQGYHFSRPMAADAAMGFLESHGASRGHRGGSRRRRGSGVSRRARR